MSVPSKTKLNKFLRRNHKQANQKKLRTAVKSMLRVMETPGDCTQDVVSEFLGTGRTGRRNAMPDILGPNAQTSCSDLPDRLENLCSVATPGPSHDISQPSTSAAVNEDNACSQQQAVAQHSPPPNS